MKSPHLEISRYPISKIAFLIEELNEPKVSSPYPTFIPLPSPEAAASYWGGRQNTLPPYCSSACARHLHDRRCFRTPFLISLDGGQGKQRSTGDEQGYCRKGEGKKKEKTGFKRYH